MKLKDFVVTFTLVSALFGTVLGLISCVSAQDVTSSRQGIIKKGTFHWEHERCWFMVGYGNSVAITMVPDSDCYNKR